MYVFCLWVGPVLAAVGVTERKNNPQSERWVGCPRELQTWAAQHGLSVAAPEGFIPPAEKSVDLLRAGSVPSSCFRTCLSSGTHLQSRNPGPALRRTMLQYGPFTEARGDI